MRFALFAATALTTTISFLVPGVGFAQETYRDWAGAYAGVTAGVVYSQAPVNFDNYLDDAFGPERIPLYAKGGLLGVTVGYNANMNGVVVGVEGDASLGNISAERHGTFDDVESNLDALLTLRGRIGFSAGNALIYGTAGLAVGHANFSAATYNVLPDQPAFAAEGEAWVGGLVAGAGVEYALGDNLSIKTEGLYYQLSSLTGSGDTGKGGFDAEYSPNGFVLRTGLNISF